MVVTSRWNGLVSLAPNLPLGTRIQLNEMANGATTELGHVGR